MLAISLLLPQDKEGSDEDDDDVPALEAAETPIAQPSFDGLRGRQTRTEKKSRKAMQKIGMKPVSGVVRVTIKKSKDIVFVISQVIELSAHILLNLAAGFAVAILGPAFWSGRLRSSSNLPPAEACPSP